MKLLLLLLAGLAAPSGCVPPGAPPTDRDNRHTSCDHAGMSSLVQKLVAEEHHLEDIAKDGYAPATLPIVLGGIVLALIAIVGLALGVTLLVYYLS